ncbi:MAG: hypothetical protein DRP00_00225 [Candidatus Aenigmatarchaeota archaeon]|nr:MAG: hypothetical protein DRP00_00225 [Candidatus Aenigmarchaeota archaeon]
MGARLSGIRDIIVGLLGILFPPFASFFPVYKIGRSVSLDAYYGYSKGDWLKPARNLSGGLGAYLGGLAYFIYRIGKGLGKLATGKYPDWELSYDQRMYGIKLA